MAGEVSERELDGERRVSRWREARPELTVAAVGVAAAAVAGWAMGGPWAVVLVAVIAAAVGLAVMRLLVPPAAPPSDVTGGADELTGRRAFGRYWHHPADLRDGIEVRPAYDSRVRPTLEHLLAARLSERHSVNLYREPAAARALLCRGGRDDDLWAWIDPEQAGPQAGTTPPASRSQPPGIPRRTLERLINRLEQL